MMAMSSSSMAMISVLSVLLVFLVNGLHGQTIFSFQAVASQSEDVGSIDVCIEVTNAGSNPMNTTLNVTTIDGDTTAGPDDFTPQSATLFFSEEEIRATPATVKCFTVNITDDMVVELNEDVAYQAMAVSSNAIVNNQEEFTITDNDEAIISFGNETAISVLESVGTISVCVNLTGPAGGLERDLTITVGDREGTATNPQDYVTTPSNPLTVMFTSGTPQGGLACGVIQIESENFVDADKDFQMFLDPVAITAAMVVEPMVINITILNDDNATLTLQDIPPLVNEGNDLQICVDLNESPRTDIIVNLAITEPGAPWPARFIASEDLSRPLNQIRFVPLQTQACDTIQIVSDQLLEGPEDFTVSIVSSDPPLMLGDPVSSTITDGDSANVSFVMAEDSASEDANTVSVCVELIDLPANGSAVAVEVEVAPAMDMIERCNPHSYARLPEDYTLPGPVTFPAGEAPPSQCLSVTIIDDTFAEDNETIRLIISSVTPSSNVGIAGITSTAITVIDNDAVNFTVPETLTTLENSTNLSLFVSILGPASNLERSINVTIEGTDGSAMAPDDFSIPMPVLMFECSENITITNDTGKEASILIVNDMILEGDETFQLSISTTPTDNVNIVNAETDVTIEDDDFTAGFEQNDFIISEGAPMNPVEFEFRVFEGVPRRETVFSVTGTSELLNIDFSILTPTVTLGPTTTNATVIISIVNDAETEQDELFQVTVSTDDESAILINNTLNITIDSDDMSEVFLSSMTAINVTEIEEAVACVAVRGSPLRTNLTVNISVTDITAELGQDYRIPDNALTFVIVPPSTETCQVVADILTDDLFEDFETFQVSIDSVDFEDVTIGSPSSQNVTIINLNELSITIQPVADRIPENGGMTDIVATPSVPGMGSAIPILIQLNFTASNATLDEDFTISGDVFNFTVSDLIVPTSRSISVIATDDEILEGDELITFELVPSDILDLPGLTVTILNENIAITDDEVIRIEFVDAVFNFTEGDTSVSVCIRPESIPAAGYSVPIETSVSVVSLDPIECSGSGLASESDFEIDDDLMFTFPPNSTTEQCFSLNITDDDLTEGLETFSLAITVISPSVIATPGPPSTVQIFDNDTITVSMSQPNVEVFENVTNATVCVDLFQGRLCTDTDINVDSFQLMFTTATANEDYIPGGFTAVLPANSVPGATACFDVTIIDDMVVEGTENFGLRLAVDDNPLVVEASSISLTQTQVSIINNDAAVRFANDSLIVNEAQVVSVCVEIFDGQLLESASVEIQVNDTQGAGNLDFMLSTTTLTFGPNDAVRCFNVSIPADVLKEVNESIALRITEDEPTIVASPDLLNITIISNDVANVSFVNDSFIQVDESVGTIQLCVELNGAAVSQELVIDFTLPSPISASVNTDFMIPAERSFTFPAGSPVGSLSCINVTIEDDERYELTEDFGIILTAPANPLCVISDPTRVDVDILDNDNITLSFNTSSVDIAEGENVIIQIVLEIPPGGIQPLVSVAFNEELITAESGDFSFSPSMVTFDGMLITPPTAFQEVDVSALLDAFVEQDREVVELSFSATSRFDPGNFTTLTVNILNINGGNLTIQHPAQTNESVGSVNVSVELSLDSGVTLEDPFNVTIAFNDSTALENLDFIPPMDDVLTFEPGSALVETVSVQIVEDQLFESLVETFTATIMNATISTLSIPVPSVDIDILDTDIANFSISPMNTSVRVLEDADSIDICIDLVGPANGLAVSVSVSYAAVDGSANIGDDFNVSPGTVAFSPGSVPGSTRCVNINILEDVLFEGEETFTFEATAVDSTRNVVDPSVSNIIIIDNELRVEYLNDSIAREFPEGDMPVFPICFSVVEGTPSIDHDVSLEPDSRSTAIEGTDYILSGNPLIINATVTSGCIEVIILNDNISENDDTISFTAATTSSGLQISNGGFLNLTIINDDFPILEFNNTKYIVNESISTIVEICIRVSPDGARIGPDHLPLEVELEFEEKTANSSDFTVSSRPISFTATSQTISCEDRVSIISDDLTEITESFILSFNHPIGGSDEVEVVIHDPDVCPNAEQGQICEDHVFLRICNTLRLKNNGVVPRSCDTVLAEYTDISYQPNGV